MQAGETLGPAPFRSALSESAKTHPAAPTTCSACVAKLIGMGTVVVCTVLLILGASITLYSEDGWMLLIVAIILAAALFFLAVS